jgi:hypothetical protein
MERWREGDGDGDGRGGRTGERSRGRKRRRGRSGPPLAPERGGEGELRTCTWGGGAHRYMAHTPHMRSTSGSSKKSTAPAPPQMPCARPASDENGACARMRDRERERERESEGERASERERERERESERAREGTVHAFSVHVSPSPSPHPLRPPSPRAGRRSTGSAGSPSIHFTAPPPLIRGIRHF